MYLGIYFICIQFFSMTLKMILKVMISLNADQIKLNEKCKNNLVTFSLYFIY